MRLSFVMCLFLLWDTISAAPRIGRRQASSCSCPPDVFVTSSVVLTSTTTSFSTITSDAGIITETATTGQTDTTTITSTQTVTGFGTTTSTRTVAGTTATVTGSTTFATNTVTFSSTVTTCIISAYKRQVMGEEPTITTNGPSDSSTITGSAPGTTTFTSTITSGGNASPVTCVCILRPGFTFSSATSTSPADLCTCPPVQTSTIEVSSTVLESTVSTMIASTYGTSILTPTTVLTTYETDTVTVSFTRTLTASVARLTVTSHPLGGTITTTQTPTFVSCIVPSQTCNNQGVRWAVYPNTNSAGTNNTNKDSTYSTFNPTLFKTRNPLYQNVTNTLGGLKYTNSQPVNIHIYNSTQFFESDYIVLNHVGYIFAQVTGTYTFTISQSDDITLLWVGANAYRGYTRANANAVNPYGAGSTTYKVNFVEGEYYPFRIIFANAQQAVIFQASLTAPDGRVVLTSNSKASPFLIQYSCDLTDAPPFPAFGSET